jgi:hypothetical protein
MHLCELCKKYELARVHSEIVTIYPSRNNKQQKTKKNDDE